MSSLIGPLPTSNQVLTSAYHGSQLEYDSIDRNDGYEEVDGHGELSDEDDEDDPSRHITRAYASHRGMCFGVNVN